MVDLIQSGSRVALEHFNQFPSSEADCLDHMIEIWLWMSVPVGYWSQTHLKTGL